MKKHIIDRYSRTESGTIIIEISSERVEDLYNDYDRISPYHRKELYQGFVDYISDSVREIGNENFLIRIILPSKIKKSLVERIQKSIQNYFLYLKELEYRELERMMRTSVILLFLGLGILAISVLLNRTIEKNESFLFRIFAEGLTVAAWISLWESLATFLINWAPHRRDIKLYEKIAGASVEVTSGS